MFLHPVTAQANQAAEEICDKLLACPARRPSLPIHIIAEKPAEYNNMNCPNCNTPL